MNQYNGNYSDRSILTFVFLYSIGRFINLHEAVIIEKIPFVEKSPWRLYFAVMFLFFVVVSFSPSLVSRGINYFARAYNSIGLILFSFLFFYCFKKMKVQNKWINAIAKSTFAIYLIHGNNIITYHRWIYNPYSSFGLTIDSIHLRLLYLLCFALIICLGCIIIDQVRQFLFRILGVDWTIQKLDAFVSNKYEMLLKNG